MKLERSFVIVNQTPDYNLKAASFQDQMALIMDMIRA
jgi:hypothetical protein